MLNDNIIICSVPTASGVFQLYTPHVLKRLDTGLGVHTKFGRAPWRAIRGEEVPSGAKCACTHMK